MGHFKKIGKTKMMGLLVVGWDWGEKQESADSNFRLQLTHWESFSSIPKIVKIISFHRKCDINCQNYTYFLTQNIKRSGWKIVICNYMYCLIWNLVISKCNHYQSSEMSSEILRKQKVFIALHSIVWDKTSMICNHYQSSKCHPWFCENKTYFNCNI